MILVEIIGFIAAILTTGAGLPQLIKTIKTKKTRDLSFKFLAVMNAGIILWLVYGLFISSWPLIIANGVTIIIWLMMLYLKIKYK